MNDRNEGGNQHGGKFPSRKEEGIAPSEYIDTGANTAVSSPVEANRPLGDLERDGHRAVHSSRVTGEGAEQKRPHGMTETLVYGAVTGVIAGAVAGMFISRRREDEGE